MLLSCFWWQGHGRAGADGGGDDDQDVQVLVSLFLSFRLTRNPKNEIHFDVSMGSATRLSASAASPTAIGITNYSHFPRSANFSFGITSNSNRTMTDVQFSRITLIVKGGV